MYSTTNYIFADTNCIFFWRQKKFQERKFKKKIQNKISKKKMFSSFKTSKESDFVVW